MDKKMSEKQSSYWKSELHSLHYENLRALRIILHDSWLIDKTRHVEKVSLKVYQVIW